MKIGETTRSAWRSLTSNRMRTLLTMLGMIIGVAAVVAVLGIGEGAKQSVESR
ncbi:MAG: ABC transporter permease, partial [Myxococcales bacterium]|nr:ABC transporter permease [Myxococcales bacterium]